MKKQKKEEKETLKDYLLGYTILFLGYVVPIWIWFIR